MVTYNDFLCKLNIPSEEEFNNIIENLPPFEKLSDDFEFDPVYDDLITTLFDYGVLGKNYPHAYVDDINYENKSVYVLDLESLEELNKLNEALTSAGWTLKNYEEYKESFLEEELAEEERIEKEELLEKLSNVNIEQLREFVKNVN